jgi:hypothetical protein
VAITDERATVAEWVLPPLRRVTTAPTQKTYVVARSRLPMTAVISPHGVRGSTTT